MWDRCYPLVCVNQAWMLSSKRFLHYIGLDQVINFHHLHHLQPVATKNSPYHQYTAKWKNTIIIKPGKEENDRGIQKKHSKNIPAFLKKTLLICINILSVKPK